MNYVLYDTDMIVYWLQVLRLYWNGVILGKHHVCVDFTVQSYSCVSIIIINNNNNNNNNIYLMFNIHSITSYKFSRLY